MPEPIQSVTSRVLLDSTPTSAATKRRAEPQSQQTIGDLFTRLGAECGHKFTSMMPDQRSRRAVSSVWAERLAGLGFEDLQRGIDRLPRYLRAHNWWPPGAAEFRELCLPGYADFGMPPLDEAYAEATKREYSHPAVAWARARCQHAFDQLNATEARRRFAREYDTALLKAREGFEFPKLNKALPQKQPPTPSVERQREHAAEMRRRLSTERFELDKEESHGST